MKYDVVVVGALETNCYLVYCPETLDCAIVDPGAAPERIIAAVAERELKPIAILNTHGHIDHIGSNREMKNKYRVPLRIHKADGPMLAHIQSVELSLLLGAEESPPADSYLKEGEAVTIGRCSLAVIHTPGHSPGSVSLLADSFLLSGDTLFCGGVGRTDLPGGSFRDLEDSIRRKLLTLSDDLLVLPGHGPRTTIGQEKDTNPFIS
ncbi:MAG: MBL fold metallo-hydrolase [Candidatus Aminicenantes bacterium]|nr:MBL fold metallo-hydrolase [Candidatus Aminicenantes bacterium]